MEEAEARARGLPDSDVFVRSHLAYHDSLNLAAMVSDLCRESYQSFTSTTLIIGREQRKVEGQATTRWFENGMVGDLPLSPYTFHFLRYSNTENLLIGTGFELALKARLLRDGYVVHEIVDQEPFKVLRARQRKDPVKIDELLAIEGYVYESRSDGQSLNHLRSLSKKSLNFDKIINEPKYRAVLGLDAQTLVLIDYYRQARNVIHLPGDVEEAPAELQDVDLTPLIVAFINEHVVSLNNDQVATNSLQQERLLNRV